MFHYQNNNILEKKYRKAVLRFYWSADVNIFLCNAMVYPVFMVLVRRKGKVFN